MSVAAARPAATILLIDPSLRVLLVQRNREVKFFGGAYAFPGGRVEASDVPATAPAHDPWREHRLAPAGTELCADRARLYAAYQNAARRELIEECQIELPADAELAAWARWITPELESKRYDTLFFVAPCAQRDVVVDGSETVGHCWLSPAEALDRAKRKEIVLPPPTFATLTELLEFTSPAALMLAASRGPLPEIFPKLVVEGDTMALVLPGDALHPDPMARPWPRGFPTRARIIPGDQGVVADFG